MLPAAGNIGRKGRGVIVAAGRNTKYRWGFVLATSRAAWPHALHDMQHQQQQQERSWREQIGSLFRQPELYGSATSRRAGGVQSRDLFSRWIHFSIGALSLVEYEVNLFTAKVKTC